jgi:putative aldouronate transport system substrate-binding protein
MLFVLFSLLAVAAMLSGCVAAQPAGAPAASQPGDQSGAPAASQEVPVLDYYYVAMSAKPEDLQEVEDAANAILEPKIGAKLKLHPLTFADITTKAPLILQSGEACDLMAMSQFNPYNNGVATGGLLALDELLPQNAPKTWAAYPKEIWDAARVNGKIYGSINNTGGWVGYAGMWARQDLLDKYKFDWQNTKTVEEWEPYFDQIVANEEGVIPLVSTDGYWGRTWFPNYFGYDPVDKGIGAPQSQGIIGVKVDDATRKVVAVPFTAEYKQAAELARRWYDKGYYLKTPPTDSEMGAMRGALKFGVFHFPGTGDFSTKAMASNEWANVPIMTQHLQEKPIITTGSIQGSITAVCAVSKHPDLAVKYIEEVNNNPELYNLLNYGIEGKHWVWVDQAKNLISYPEGVDGQTVGYNPNTYWQFGDRHQLRLMDESDLGVFDRIDEGMQKALFSPVLGFTPNRDPIQNEIAQLSTVAKQYCDPLEKGLVDPVQGLAECQSKLKEAGIDTVLTEIQSQIDAWAKANGK